MRLSKKKIELLLSSDINSKNYFEHFCEFWLPIYKHQVIDAKLEENKEALSEIMLNLVKNWNLADVEKRYIAKKIGIYYLVEKSEKDMTSKGFNRYMDAIQETKKVCKCGYKVPMMESRGYGICINCRTKVYGDKKLEFKEKLKQKMKEGL